MKYMSFRASCSYAGVANMLEQLGVHVQDRDIALGMGHPWLFAKEGGAYLTGPMLQSARWFDLYLRTIGFRMKETLLPAQRVSEHLRARQTAMLGLKTGSGKHAVVWMGQQEDRLLFRNNKWEHSDEPEIFALTEAELLDRIDGCAMVAELVRAEPERVDLTPLRRQSATVVQANLEDIRRLCAEAVPVSVIREQMDPLFRALLLDEITMLELAGESGLARELSEIQARLLGLLRQGPEEIIRLGDRLPLSGLEKAVGAYIRRIEAF